jgi:hypothetical protein
MVEDCDAEDADDEVPELDVGVNSDDAPCENVGELKGERTLVDDSDDVGDTRDDEDEEGADDGFDVIDRACCNAAASFAFLSFRGSILNK